jgi:hypothetical protein
MLLAVSAGCALLAAAAPGPADAGSVLCERKGRVRMRVDVCKAKERQILELGDPGVEDASLSVAANANGVAALEASIEQQTTQLAALEASVAANAASAEGLAESLDAILEADLTSEQLAVLGEFLTALSRVDLPRGDGTWAPTLRLSGVNLQIVDGSGSTGEPNEPGVGNLIVGYNEYPRYRPRLFERTGSHTVVIGDHHSWTSYGGFVAGYQNAVSAPSATVTGGAVNRATEREASVSGGRHNEASGLGASVCGGLHNEASGWFSSVGGGGGNHASGQRSSVGGGGENTASGEDASVLGGYWNEAEGWRSAVSGGGSNRAVGFEASVSGGHENVAEGRGSTVSGGEQQTASGEAEHVP